MLHQNLNHMFNFLPSLLVMASTISLSFGQTIQQPIPVAQEFSLPITVNSADKATLGADIVLSFDPKILKITKIKPTNLYPFYPENLQDIDNAHGKLSFSGSVGMKTPIIVNGTLAEVFFVAQKEGSTKIEFVWKTKNSSATHLVPKDEGIDLLTQTPDPITLSFRPSSKSEQFLFNLKRFLSLDFLQL